MPKRRAIDERTWAVEDVPLDRARPQDVLGQRAQDGLLAEPEPQGPHPAEEPPLPIPDLGESVGEPALILGRVDNFWARCDG